MLIYITEEPIVKEFKTAVPFAATYERQALIYNWIGVDSANIKHYKAGLFYLKK